MSPKSWRHREWLWIKNWDPGTEEKGKSCLKTMQSGWKSWQILTLKLLQMKRCEIRNLFALINFLLDAYIQNFWVHLKTCKVQRRGFKDCWTNKKTSRHIFKRSWRRATWTGKENFLRLKNFQLGQCARARFERTGGLGDIRSRLLESRGTFKAWRKLLMSILIAFQYEAVAGVGDGEGKTWRFYKSVKRSQSQLGDVEHRWRWSKRNRWVR